MAEIIFVLAGKSKQVFAELRLAAQNHGEKTLKDLIKENNANNK